MSLYKNFMNLSKPLDEQVNCKHKDKCKNFVFQKCWIVFMQIKKQEV